MQDQFIRKWHSDINSFSKGVVYKLFKSNFKCEKNLCVLPLKLRFFGVNFRPTNHRLTVELGQRTGTVFSLDERFCTNRKNS